MTYIKADLGLNHLEGKAERVDGAWIVHIRPSWGIYVFDEDSWIVEVVE